MNKIKIRLCDIISVMNIDVDLCSELKLEIISVDKHLVVEVEKDIIDSIIRINGFIPDGLELKNKGLAELMLSVFKVNKVLAKHDYTIVPKFNSNIPLDFESNHPTYILVNEAVEIEDCILVQDLSIRKKMYSYFMSGKQLLDMIKKRGYKQLLKQEQRLCEMI